MTDERDLFGDTHPLRQNPRSKKRDYLFEALCKAWGLEGPPNKPQRGGINAAWKAIREKGVDPYKVQTGVEIARRAVKYEALGWGTMTPCALAMHWDTCKPDAVKPNYGPDCPDPHCGGRTIRCGAERVECETCRQKFYYGPKPRPEPKP